MDVICEQCQTKLGIPDEKVPKDHPVRITCPKCETKMTLNPNRPTTRESANSESEERTPPAKQPKGGYDYADYSDDDTLHFFEEGTKLSLVLMSNGESSEKIKGAVELMGYKFIPAPSTRDAIGKLRFHHFDLIVLSDGFDGQPIDHSPILNYLNNLSMSIRRKIFLALLSDAYKTMDNMMALAMSANIVVSTKDLDKLHPILKKAISENERFYKIFTDILVETGKA
jgi:hypothetical protein